MHTQDNTVQHKIHLSDGEHLPGLSSYPSDMTPFITLLSSTLDVSGVPYHGNLASYHPTSIAQYALAHWNEYLATSDESHQRIFLTQAHWLVEHEVGIGDDAGGWPISFPHPDIPTGGPWLSALAQGSAISVLVRAYQLTQESAFLEVARRAVRTFDRDILDGGVSTPLGSDGIFFEEVAVYPAAHMLSGFIFALFGLYDYVALTGDPKVKILISCSLATLHSLLDEFDVGFWTRSDLLHRHLSTDSQLVLQSMLLEALSSYSGCVHCSTIASRWKDYQLRFGSRLRYLITSRGSHFGRVLAHRVRALLLHRAYISPALAQPALGSPIRVCAPITAFPVMGGMRTGLTAVYQVTRDIWQMEFLTQHVGPDADELIIHQFSTSKMGPWQFPNVWFYFLAGCRKLISLLRHGADYGLLLPQDGVFTSAFAALVAKLVGVRVVCMDYGNMTLLHSRHYRTERVKALATKNWSRLRRLLAHVRFAFYWPSLNLLARLAARFVDHFLVSGIAGDGVEEVYCGQLGVHPSRITRYAYMIDLDRHVVLDTTSQADLRAKHGIDPDALVITMICRLAPEKGVDIALESISQALSLLSPERAARVRVIIAGDGPLRKQVEEDIFKRGLSQVCLLWGEASRADVISILSISDIFLHTSTRGAYYTLSLLEAMASACAIVASTEPPLNVQLFAEGRGMVVPAGDAEQTAKALVQVLNDPELRHQMGNLAREYIAVYHSPATLRRTLMRVTYWSALDEVLGKEKFAASRECEN